MQQLVAQQFAQHETQGGVVMIKKFFITAMLLSTLGCTSFRTTALYRFANDSVAPQKTNKKLKGLPVKLKVPSHVQVTVYEQQVILARSKEEIKGKTEESSQAAKRVQEQQNVIKAFDNEIQKYQASINESAIRIKELGVLIDGASNDEYKKEIEKVLAKEIQALSTAQADLQVAKKNKDDKKANEENTLAKLITEADLAAKNATIEYAIVSFTPPQYMVERELQYTDKVFLVDFKRPAGGVLDLTEASMDDEQYFAAVKAKITERTLEDVAEALKTVKDPLSKLAKKQSENTAIPTTSETPVAESNNNVNFQKSVIATQRFDISEAGWEERLQSFVSEFIAVDNGQTALEGYPLEVSPELSDGQVVLPADAGHPGHG